MSFIRNKPPADVSLTMNTVRKKGGLMTGSKRTGYERKKPTETEERKLYTYKYKTIFLRSVSVYIDCLQDAE